MAAERVETYWRLEAVGDERPTRAVPGQPFFEQRLLPVRLVRLAEPITIGGRTLPEGTFLYYVFNADNRVGYCTIKERSPGSGARLFSIPILDQRPCLVDRDEDGRFDHSFSVYDKWGGPPTVRGSINGAQPIGATAGYEVVDIHQFPVDMRMSLTFRGSTSNPQRSRIRITFSDTIGGAWEEIHGTGSLDGTLFDIGNVQVRLQRITADQAVFDMDWRPDSFISSDNRNTLYWSDSLTIPTTN